MPSVIDNKKSMDLAKYFVLEKEYKEFHIEGVAGIILMNAEEEYQIVRIVPNMDLNYAKLIEYANENHVRILNIYFEDQPVISNEFVNNVLIQSNEDIKNNPALQSFDGMDKYINFDQMQAFEEAFEQINAAGVAAANNKRLANLRDIARRTRFSRTFVTVYFIINILLHLYLGSDVLVYRFGYYSLFNETLHEWYRLFVNIFISDNIVALIVVSLLMLQMGTVIELRVGTGKMISILLGSLVFTYLSMYLFNINTITYGSLPLVMIFFGSFIATIMKPKTVKLIPVASIFFVIYIGLLMVSAYVFDLNTTIIAFTTSFIFTYMFGLLQEKVTYEYSFVFIVILLFMFTMTRVKHDNLIREAWYEKGYIEQVKEKNRKLGDKYERTLKEYYAKIGVDYNE